MLLIIFIFLACIITSQTGSPTKGNTPPKKNDTEQKKKDAELKKKKDAVEDLKKDLIQRPAKENAIKKVLDDLKNKIADLKRNCEAAKNAATRSSTHNYTNTLSSNVLSTSPRKQEEISLIQKNFEMQLLPLNAQLKKVEVLYDTFNKFYNNKQEEVRILEDQIKNG